MIQDIAPHVFCNAYRESTPDLDSIVMIAQEGGLLVNVQDGLAQFPRLSQVSHIEAEAIYLFSLDDQPVFWLSTDQTVSLPGYASKNRRGFRGISPKHASFAGLTALQLIDWYRSNGFCGRCGAQMERDHDERMLRCPKCEQMVYPRINPAVIVGVRNGDKLLLTKYAGREHSNYALIAGFTEIGETVEETVSREVLEEAGVHVKNITYYKSQPWAMTDTLLMGYFCDVDGDDTITMDDGELAVAEWVHRGDIDVRYEDFALTNEMICRFKDGLA